MLEKSDKTNPVLIPDELIAICSEDDSTIVPSFVEKLRIAKNVYEQMNCLGLLKQATLEGASRDVYLFVCGLFLLPSTQALRKSTYALMTLYLKRDRSGIIEAFAYFSDILVSNKFLFPYNLSMEYRAEDVLSNWVSFPDVLHIVSEERMRSVADVFLYVIKGYMDNAMLYTDRELQQGYISKCTSILKNINIFMPHTGLEMDAIKSWEDICMQIMRRSWIKMEDINAACQLWFALHYLKKTPYHDIINLVKVLLVELQAGTMLRMMMLREVVRNIPQDIKDSDEYVESLVSEVCTSLPSSSDEVIVIIQTCMSLYSTYRQAERQFSSKLSDSVLGFLFKHLNNPIRKVSRLCEESIVSFVNNWPPNAYRDQLLPYLTKAYEAADSVRSKLSLISVLIKGDSVNNILDMKPPILDYLYSLLSEKDSTYCSQVKTVIVDLFVKAYLEMDRKEWYRLIIGSLLNAIYSTATTRANIFNYVIPALLNTKALNLPSEVREEEPVLGDREPDTYSIFELDLYLLWVARSYEKDDTTEALLELCVLNVDKELGIIGKKGEPYIDCSPSKPRSCRLAKTYSRCGQDDVRMSLLKLITTSLYTTQPITEEEWPVLVNIVKESCYTSSPSYRHDFIVCLKHLVERIILSTKSILKKGKDHINRERSQHKEPLVKSMSFEILQSVVALHKEYDQIMYGKECICEIWKYLLDCIEPSAPTHRLLIVSDTMNLLMQFFDLKSAFPIPDIFTAESAKQSLVLMKNQNGQVRQNGSKIVISICQNMQHSSTVASFCDQILEKGLSCDNLLTDYEVSISATHLFTYYEVFKNLGEGIEDPTALSHSQRLSPSALITKLVERIDRDTELMHQSSDFMTYAIPTCQSALQALELIFSAYPSLIEERQTYQSLLTSCYNIYRETLNIVADNEIFTGDDSNEDSADSLLSKGPIQPSLDDEDGDFIAKNKLDCRGHIIGEADPEQTERLKRLMLSSWLTCKHSVILIATLVDILDKKYIEKSSDDCIPMVDNIKSFLHGDTVMSSVYYLGTCDIVFLIWDLLCSVLTIKHIGGIIFVADAIEVIFKRITSLGPEYASLLMLPSFFLSLLLGESNINNRNFILRRSTGFSQAFSSILVSSPSLVNKYLCKLFLLAAPDRYYFQSIPSDCVSSSLDFTKVDFNTTWKSRVHALNIVRQLFIDRNIAIEDYHCEPALMIALEALSSDVWQIKNSGLMVYTAVLKKMFNNNVNDDTSKNPSLEQFFSRFPCLRKWFSVKLTANKTNCNQSELPLSVAQELVTTAGLQPIYFGFILLASRLSGYSNSMEDEWLSHTIEAISRLTGCQNLFYRTMVARAFTVLLPTSEHLRYALIAVKMLSFFEAATNNSMHGLILQIQQILTMAVKRKDLDTFMEIYKTIVTNWDAIIKHISSDFVLCAFLELLQYMIENCSKYDVPITQHLQVLLEERENTGSKNAESREVMRRIYALLVFMGYRASVNSEKSDFMEVGRSLMVKILRNKDICDLILSIKIIRKCVNLFEALQSQDNCICTNRLLADVLTEKLFSNPPQYVLLPLLKTMMSINQCLYKVKSDEMKRLVSMWEKAPNAEMKHWFTRVIVQFGILSNENDMEDMWSNVLTEAIIDMDITLSYRSMLCDVFIYLSEIPQKSNRMVSFLMLIMMWLLEDSNDSIKAILQKSPFSRGNEMFTNGVTGMMQICFDARTDEALSNEYTKLLSRVLTSFVKRNMPKSLAEEAKGIYHNDSSCVVPHAVILSIEYFNCKDNMKNLREALDEWKAKKAEIPEWSKVEERMIDIVSVIESMDKVVYACFLEMRLKATTPLK